MNFYWIPQKRQSLPGHEKLFRANFVFLQS